MSALLETQHRFFDWPGRFVGTPTLRRTLSRPYSWTHVDDLAVATVEFFEHVRCLPPRQRAVVALHYLDDLPIATIAEVLRLRTGTVKSTLSRARKSLALSMTAHETRQTPSADTNINAARTRKRSTK